MLILGNSSFFSLEAPVVKFGRGYVSECALQSILFFFHPFISYFTRYTFQAKVLFYTVEI